jgi:DNA-binding response OmpR family regulator
MSAHILLVEDDPNLGFVIKDNLEVRGYAVTLCADGDAGTATFRQQRFDACILDVMMPKKDGFAVARSIREANQHVPILFITAKSMLPDKREGFTAGGDDYLVKPFSMDELCMRLEVFLRRTKETNSEFYRLGDYSFDVRNLHLTHPKINKSLTTKEAEVLRLLCAHPNQVLKREAILKQVWGDDDYFMGRSMDVFISKLRKYLREDPRVQIQNHHGVGFKLEVRT